MKSLPPAHTTYSDPGAFAGATKRSTCASASEVSPPLCAKLLVGWKTRPAATSLRDNGMEIFESRSSRSDLSQPEGNRPRDTNRTCTGFTGCDEAGPLHEPSEVPAGFGLRQSSGAFKSGPRQQKAAEDCRTPKGSGRRPAARCNSCSQCVRRATKYLPGVLGQPPGFRLAHSSMVPRDFESRVRRGAPGCGYNHVAAGAGLAARCRVAGAAARLRKLTQSCCGNIPRAMMTNWLATNAMSHLKAASMKP